MLYECLWVIWWWNTVLQFSHLFSSLNLFQEGSFLNDKISFFFIFYGFLYNFIFFFCSLSRRSRSAKINNKNKFFNRRQTPTLENNWISKHIFSWIKWWDILWNSFQHNIVIQCQSVKTPTFLFVGNNIQFFI